MEIRELARRYAEGDKSCYDELYKKSYELAYRIIRGMIKNEDDAHDLTQDSFIKAMEKLPSMPRPEGFAAYLAQTAKNTALTFLDSAYYKKTMRYNFNTYDEEGKEVAWEDITPTTDQDTMPDIVLDENTRKEIMAEILGTLTKEQREAILLCYYDGLTIKAAAEVLGLDMSTVRGRLDTSKKALKTEVEKIQERDGIKLYNVSIVPFLLWLFGGFKKEYPTAFDIAESGMCSTGGTFGNAASAKTVQNGVETVQKTISNTAKKAVNGVGNTAQKASVISQITKTVACVAVLTGVGYGGYKFLHNDDKTVAENSAVVETTPSAAPETVKEPEKLKYADVTVTVPEGWTAKETYFSPEEASFKDTADGMQTQPVLVLYEGEANDENPHMYIYSYGYQYGELHDFIGETEELAFGDRTYYCSVPSEQRIISTNVTDVIDDPTVFGYWLKTDSPTGSDGNIFYVDYYTMGKGTKEDEAITTVLTSLEPDPIGTVTITGTVQLRLFNDRVAGWSHTFNGTPVNYYETAEENGVKMYRISAISWIAAGEGVVENN